MPIFFVHVMSTSENWTWMVPHQMLLDQDVRNVLSQHNRRNCSRFWKNTQCEGANGNSHSSYDELPLVWTVHRLAFIWTQMAPRWTIGQNSWFSGSERAGAHDDCPCLRVPRLHDRCQSELCNFEVPETTQDSQYHEVSREELYRASLIVLTSFEWCSGRRQVNHVCTRAILQFTRPDHGWKPVFPQAMRELRVEDALLYLDQVWNHKIF